MGLVRHSNPTPAPLPAVGRRGALAFVATMRGTPSRKVLDTALAALTNLGRLGSSGILTHIPDALLREDLGPSLPPVGGYALGFAYLDPAQVARQKTLVADIAAAEGFAVFAWRDVPINDTLVDIPERACMPALVQVVFIPAAGDDADSRLYRLRKRIERVSTIYFASLSRSTVVYKGLVVAPQLASVYGDLADPRYRTEIAIVHACSTQLDRWRDAQPFRLLSHDGSLTSDVANRTWLRARTPLINADVLGPVDEWGPVIGEDTSGPAALDELTDLLHRGGRSLPHAMRMLAPAAPNPHRSPAEVAFAAYNATVVEPWEGSGVTCFAEGGLIGVSLDRHGTRNGRYWVTESGLVVFASEPGLVDADPSTITLKGRLAAGEMFAVDTTVGQILPTGALTAHLATLHPYADWLTDNLTEIVTDAFDLPGGSPSDDPALYGLSTEMVDGVTNQDTRLEGVTDRPVTFFDRFHTRRPQLTGPHIHVVPGTGPDRVVVLGPEANLLDDGAEHARKFALRDPILSGPQANELFGHPGVARLTACIEPGTDLATALDDLRARTGDALAQGPRLLVVSNHGGTDEARPIPSLLAVAAVHQHLLEIGARARVGLVAEVGDAYTPAHVARLLATGAEAIYPYLALELATSADYLTRLREGLAELIQGEGVTSYRSYCGSESFHVIGIAPDVVKKFFPDALRALGGYTLSELGVHLQGVAPTLDGFEDLITLTPIEEPVSVDDVEDIVAIGAHFSVTEPVVVSAASRPSLTDLAHADAVILRAPQELAGRDGFDHVVTEVRRLNPTAQVYARIGSDLATGAAALEANAAGVDTISFADVDHPWLFGLASAASALASRNGEPGTRTPGASEPLPTATLAVGIPLDTAHEVVIAAALGASEFRVTGDPLDMAAQVRELLASLGLVRFGDAVGRADLLDLTRAYEHWAEVGVDLGGVFREPAMRATERPHPTDSLEDTVAELVDDAISSDVPVRINAFVSPADRSVGTQLAGEISRRRGPQGLPEGTIHLLLTGAAGAGLGDYLPHGVKITVYGEAGNEVGKGLAGGRIALRPDATANYLAHENVIAGNNVGYGAAAGTILCSGQVGERLGMHNDGATIVCEGASDGVAQTMTGGTILVLGSTGTGIGAGMTGGTIYALDLDRGNIDSHANTGAHGTLGVSQLTDVDIRVVTAVLAEHVEATGSRVATALLDDPDQLSTRLSKIEPPGYDPRNHSGARTGLDNVWDRILSATHDHEPSAQ